MNGARRAPGPHLRADNLTRCLHVQACGERALTMTDWQHAEMLGTTECQPGPACFANKESSGLMQDDCVPRPMAPCLLTIQRGTLRELAFGRSRQAKPHPGLLIIWQ